MHDAGERAASLVIRDGDSGVLDDAVRWYRDHDRLRLGDPVAMAQDAFDAWMSDHNRDGGGDSLLIADRWEIADALNERIHRHLVADDAETVTGARRHRIRAGDVVISRRNDPTIEVSRRGSKRGNWSRLLMLRCAMGNAGTSSPLTPRGSDRGPPDRR